MAKARVAMVADAHLGGPGGSAGELVAQLESAAREGLSRLLLLGDLCHVWVGDRRFETPEVAALAQALAELRAGGVEVDYIEGNRDFFLAGSPYQSSFDQVASEVALELDGRHYLAVHGDGLDKNDRMYRFWRWLSKSAPSRFLITHLPSVVAQGIMMRTERQLAKTNFKHRRRIPWEAIDRYARRRFSEGYEVLLLGHFHEGRRWRVAGGEVRLVDAWFRSRRLEWLGEDRES